MQSLEQNNNCQENLISFQETSPQKASNQKSLEKPSLSPFLANSLTCSDYGYVCYNQRKSLIINASQSTIILYDAITLKEIKSHELDDWVSCVSYCDEIDTYIIGCDSGFFYSYDCLKDELKQLKKREGDVLSVEFMGSRFYAFLLSESKEIYIGNLEDENMANIGWHNIKPIGLCYLQKSELLLANFDNGFVKIFNKNLREIFLVQAHQNKMIYGLHSFYIKGKEYVITSGRDETLKIFHLIKGRMRLLKAVKTAGKTADSAIYLENYKMVAVSYETNHIDFFKLPSWKLEKTFCFARFSERHGLFLMKDKNMIGCTGTLGFGYKAIDFLQLKPQKDEDKI